jgi:hypothetical protein
MPITTLFKHTINNSGFNFQCLILALNLGTRQEITYPPPLPFPSTGSGQAIGSGSGRWVSYFPAVPLSRDTALERHSSPQALSSYPAFYCSIPIYHCMFPIHFNCFFIVVSSTLSNVSLYMLLWSEVSVFISARVFP